MFKKFKQEILKYEEERKNPMSTATSKSFTSKKGTSYLQCKSFTA